MIDQYDRRILRILQQDGRITNQQLAQQVDLSAAACWRRVKAMEEAGVIQRYAALLDPRQLEQGLTVVLMVQLSQHNRAYRDAFETRVKGLSEVLQCYALTGNADFMLRVQVPDMAAYDRFLNDNLFTLEGVAQVQSNFALREVKYETAFDI